MWSHVGVIAAIGFGIGILVPAILGRRPGPDVPNEGHGNAAAMASAAVARSASAAASAEAAPIDVPGGVVSREETVQASAGQVMKCKNEKGKTSDSCGDASFDELLTPVLTGLAKCPSALGLEGKMSVGFEIDFKKKTVKPQRGKSTTLPSSTVDGVLGCVERGLLGLSLDAVKADQARYIVFYTATFVPPGKAQKLAAAAIASAAPSASAAPDAAPTDAGKMVEVAWTTCQVRDAPKTGGVLLKVTKGTKLRVLSTKGDWVKVALDGKLKEGWIYKAALGD